MSDSQQEKDKPQEEKKDKPQEEKKSDEQDQKGESENSSPRRRPPKSSRHNKLYRTPPTPEPEVMLKRESSFVLDSRVVSSISEDYSRANPKVGSALPPYNSQRDSHVRAYFKFTGVTDTLTKNKQEPPGTCIEGAAIERFFTSGHGSKYLTPRNELKPDGRSQATGYSNEERMGHGKLWQHPNPELAKYDSTPREFQGYNGRFGYRRTTPGLREKPSPFGVGTKTHIY